MSLIAVRRLLRRYGVETVSASEENGNGDAFGELIEGIIGQIAEFERKRILERVRSGKEAKKRLGKFVHGRVPCGYLLQDGEFKPDPKRVDVVRQIFLDARDGHSPGRIAKRLNHEQVSPPRAAAWNRQTVRGIIENPAYAGELHGVKQAHPAMSAGGCGIKRTEN